MANSASLKDFWMHASSVIPETQAKGVGEAKSDLQSARLRVHTGVADGFLSDQSDLIANEWMKASWSSIYRKRHNRFSISALFPQHRCQQLAQLVLFRCGYAESVKGGSTLVDSLT